LRGSLDVRSRASTFVFFLVEAERDLRTPDENRPTNEVRVFHHEVDRVFLRFRQRSLLEHGAPRADEVEEAILVDVLLEKLARRGCLVDVDLLDVDLLRIQETPGVLARGSGGFRVEEGLGHFRIVK
jgi:hypothetical protein